MRVFRSTQIHDIAYMPTTLLSKMPGPVAVPVAMETTKILDDVHGLELWEAHSQQLQESESCCPMNSAAAGPRS